MGFVQIMLGVVGGVYLAQNYNLPNIKNLLASAFVEGKKAEERQKAKDSASSPKGS